MNTQTIREALVRYVAETPGNFLTAGDALDPADVGLRFFDEPLVGVAPAEDEGFERLRRPEAVGPWFRGPKEWLPGARSVISLFFPYSREVKATEIPGSPDPSPAWLNARIEGEKLVKAAGVFLREFLRENGYAAVIPTGEKQFWSVWAPGTNPAAMADPAVGFTSPWSERHVGYVCGLGTFGLSAGLITEKGICGRLNSLVTDAILEPTPRTYEGVYDHCTHCGACARRCPVGAIDPEKGKDHLRCGARINETKILYAPRYGCDKCQVGVPCTSGIPRRKNQEE